ncbi:BspA family leucine-rich repeat surface protein [Lactococcus piscium]|uniref:MucBP domain-containing protein n=1 Tax=Pseudolactococcus carnosus TaxID=2749961 RepID=UPI001FBC09E1|nr:MucBP domain-containing protein [Lactococcus carnosus]MCJ1996103.1 BspA family leucine-rich repeat surface protein [Lactococcus carnosus]
MRKKENRLLYFTPTRKIKGISGLILCGVLLTHTTATSATTLLETKAQLPDPKTTYQNLPETASLSTIDKLTKQNVSPQPSTEKKLDTPNTTSVDNIEKASVANPDLQQGLWGTCPVTLDAVGNLTVGAGELSRTFPFNNGYKGDITSITLTGPVVAPVNSSGLLSFENLLSIKGMENLDTTQVTDMSQMFSGYLNLSSLDISHLNTDKVTNMQAMFDSSLNLTSLDFSRFNTANVTNMRDMFFECERIETLDLSTFDTSKVEDMHTMFDSCRALKTLDLSNFNTANVTDVQFMFANSTNLTALNLLNFDFTSVKKYYSGFIFSNLPSLAKLTLGTKIYFDSYMSLKDSSKGLIWRNIGQGTEESPQGKNIWTATELLENYDPEKHSGIYVLAKSPFTAKKLTINYVDEAGKQLLDSKIQEGFVGDPVNIADYLENINGYLLKEFNRDIIRLTDKEQTLTFVYRIDKGEDKTSALLIINYVDETGKQIRDYKTETGVVGDKIDLASYKEVINGYTFKRFENEITELVHTKQAVTLVYSKNQGKTSASLTINYVDEAGNQILDPKTYEGVVGERINLETYEIKIDGYSFKNTTNAITEFTDKEQTVTLVYRKDKSKTIASLTVKYVDETGKQLLNFKTHNGYVGDLVDLNEYKKNIDGYTFKRFENEITELANTEQTVTLLYSKNEVKATLTINYVDEAGKKLLDPKTYEGVVGERINLDIYEKKIDGYSFKKTTNAITEFTDKEQTVTFIYSKNKVKSFLTINYVDEAGNQILNPKTYEGVVGERVNLETYKINISGYSFKGFENKITDLTNTEQTVTLVYSKNKVKATLTINYVDETGKQILDPNTYEGVVGERVNLKTYEKKIDGYSFKEFDNEITELTDGEQTITLIYTVAMSDAPSDDNSDKTQNKLPEESNVDTNKPKKSPLKLVKLLPKTGESRSNGLTEKGGLTALVASLFMLLRRRRH